MNLNKIIIIMLFIFAQSLYANTALAIENEVFFVDIGESSREAEEIKIACDLLGAQFKAININTINPKEALKSITQLYDKEIIIISEKVLKYFNKDIVSLILNYGRKTKILILGITSNTDNKSLRIWSENKIKQVTRFSLPHNSRSIEVVKDDQISGELGGLEYPLTRSGSETIDGFELADKSEAMSLIEVVSKSGKSVCPVFLKTNSAKSNVFFLTSRGQKTSSETNNLIKIMPILIFLKYSLEDRCWHGINDYANLTIDDPWLRNPYGYINFKDLCEEAEKTRFHATIAFIPYNYQKSHGDAIKIFRNCTKNLSLSIHGNNHDFSEFEVPENTETDEKNIIQALHRMDIFSQQTGILFNRVMIFPRGIFTKESLELLKKHNFLITANSTRPFNAGPIANIVDRLRGITFEYKNFPMVLRFGLPDWKNDKEAAAETKHWIQMRLFLDLPVLLYTHHSFFKEGACNFSPIARFINEKQPKVSWADLGTIANNLYLQKRKDDSEIEVLAYSSNINIKNNYPTTMKYVIKKQEDFLIPVKSVEINGLQQEYTKDGDNIRIEVVIKPGFEKNLRIIYRSDYPAGSLSPPDRNFQVALIRTLSDFRDNSLSKLPLGDKIINIFYLVGGVKNVVIIFLGIMSLALILFIRYVIKNKYKKNRAH